MTTELEVLKPADFASDQDVRWCPGCGDYSILAQMKKVLPTLGIPREKTVFISGIGCSSRLPHYLGTFGFHSLHGRALPVACGIKSRRPELDVWVATGDGDCFSIGAAHWIHAIRYNMDMVLMVFDNAIYGLTKAQTSPTSPLGMKTNTHPGGAIIRPHNPLTVTLGITNCSFVAQVVDWNPPLLYEALKAAHRHRGTGFVRIVQRCPVYAEPYVKALQSDPNRLLLLTHEQGLPVSPSAARAFPNQRRHDPRDLGAAWNLARDDSVIPVGLLYQNPDAPCYEDLSSRGSERSPEERQAAFDGLLDAFTI